MGLQEFRDFCNVYARLRKVSLHLCKVLFYLRNVARNLCKVPLRLCNVPHFPDVHHLLCNTLPILCNVPPLLCNTFPISHNSFISRNASSLSRNTLLLSPQHFLHFLQHFPSSMQHSIQFSPQKKLLNTKVLSSYLPLFISGYRMFFCLGIELCCTVGPRYVIVGCILLRGRSGMVLLF